MGFYGRPEIGAGNLLIRRLKFDFITGFCVFRHCNRGSRAGLALRAGFPSGALRKHKV